MPGPTFIPVSGLAYATPPFSFISLPRDAMLRKRCWERDNARNNARCTKARKATHGLDGQHQDVDRNLRGRVNQNDRGQGEMEKVRPWCGQPSDRGRLKIRSELCIRGTSHGPVSVCLCLSVTSRSSTKTAKRRITQTTPHDSSGL